MSVFKVNTRCNGCLACVENCSADALRFKDNGDTRMLLHNIARCARCGQCWRVCPQEAVEFKHLLHGEWKEAVRLPLIRCRVCDRPLYAKTTETDPKQDHLCAKHRRAATLSAWPGLTAKRHGP